MKFPHFGKQQPSTEQPAAPPQAPKQEAAAAPQEIKQEPAASAPENKLAEPLGKTYLKAMPLKDVADVEKVKSEVESGNIIILRVTPLANKSIDDVKNAVNELTQFSESIGGDIARLGEERVVICPKNIRIWRKKRPGRQPMFCLPRRLQQPESLQNRWSNRSDACLIVQVVGEVQCFLFLAVAHEDPFGFRR